MRFHYHLPFGAELQPDGQTRFRLWAPNQSSVSLVLGDAGPDVPMREEGGGWFAVETGEAEAGTAYRFRLPDGLLVPDPCSRAQADDAHGPSLVVDPKAYDWQTSGWRGRPWEETVLYELHTGAFSEEGTFDGIRRRLDHFSRIGVTAVELMPVADFPGRRGWGYDGVLHFAPDRAYGDPASLKRLIDEAHSRGLMVFLDVVYNHFGPDANYLHVYAKDFFTDRHATPWGAAIDFSRRPVRDFYVHNALYWLEEYRVDGLRFDAVHAIVDDSDQHILHEIAAAVRTRVDADRQVHLVLENDANQSRFIGDNGYVAQWNDDIHHAYHVLLTGEDGGYYADYADRPAARLARGLAEGFIYQGDPSSYRDGELRGEPSTHLSPTHFVGFLQNHDQIGNRAFGDRLTRLADPPALQAALAVLLVCPQIPMLFMGEEWAADQPYLYFCDFHDELAEAVRNGRRQEFARFPEFADPAIRQKIPDPNASATFDASRLDWPTHSMAERVVAMDRVRQLVALRFDRIVPRLAGVRPGTAKAWTDGALSVSWIMGDGAELTLIANLAKDEAAGTDTPPGRLIFETVPGMAVNGVPATLPPWSVMWYLEAPDGLG